MIYLNFFSLKFRFFFVMFFLFVMFFFLCNFGVTFWPPAGFFRLIVNFWRPILASGGFFSTICQLLASHIGLRRFFFDKLSTFGVPYWPPAVFFRQFVNFWRPILASGGFFSTNCQLLASHIGLRRFFLDNLSTLASHIGLRRFFFDKLSTFVDAHPFFDYFCTLTIFSTSKSA